MAFWIWIILKIVLIWNYVFVHWNGFCEYWQKPNYSIIDKKIVNQLQKGGKVIGSDSVSQPFLKNWIKLIEKL